MFKRKFGGWSFEIKNDSTLESGNRLHFRYLSKTMPLFRGDSSLYSPCTRGRSETSFDFLSFSLSTLKPFHPIGRAWLVLADSSAKRTRRFGEMSCADAIRELHYCASSIKHADKHI